MKKLLIAVDTYYPKRDGVVVFLNEVVPALSKYFDITIIAPAFGKEKLKPIGKSRLVALPVFPTLQLAGYNSIIFSRKNIAKIKRAAKESDIIWSQDLALIGALAIKYGRRYKKPVVNYVHQVTWEHVVDLFSMPEWLKRFFAVMIRWIVRRLYNKCTLLMVPYKRLGYELMHKGIKSRKKFVRLGVNTKKFHPAANKDRAKKRIGINPKFKVVGYCGRISTEKNLDTLIKAYSDISNNLRNAFLLIVGNGDKEIIKRFRQLRNAKVTGFVDDVVPYLQAMDVFVMPSLTETTSLATLEAMSCGLAVVSTRVGYIREYLIDKYNGIFFPEDNPYLLARKIERLLANDGLRKRLGDNAHELITSKFSWERTIKKIRKTLTDVSELN